MKCLVITKKHIIISIAAIILIPSSVLFIKGIDNEAVSAFKASDIVKEALPESDEITYIKKIKAYIKKQLETEEILNSYSSGFKKQTPKPEKKEAPPPPSPTPVPTEEKQITSISDFKNETQYKVSAEDFKNEPYTLPKNASVLIVHTHTTESYSEDSTSRNINEEKNITAIGNVFEEEFKKMNIPVIHDKTVHDYPSYQGAYGRSLKTIQKNIEKDKSIAIVLDIHRDAVIKSDGTRIKLTSNINGERCAQIMIVCGTDSTGLSHPMWRSNLNFAVKISEQSEKMFPGLMRPINLREERFNQHLTEGSLIIEVGTNGNTLEEAKAGAEYAAKAIGNVILECKK